MEQSAALGGPESWIFKAKKGYKLWRARADGQAPRLGNCP